LVYFVPPKSVCILLKATFYAFYASWRRVVCLSPTFKQFVEPNKWPLFVVTVQSFPITDDHTDSTASEGKCYGMATLRHLTTNYITLVCGVENLFNLFWKCPAVGSCGRHRLSSRTSSCLSSVSPNKSLYVLTNYYFFITLLLDPM
jgi:hypothetical protein